MSDLIKRQAAISIVTFECGKWTGLSKEINKQIQNLPSVEPEIVMCKECKHRGEEPIADGRYWCDIHDTFMYYCSDAERRTDEQ